MFCQNRTIVFHKQLQTFNHKKMMIMSLRPRPKLRNFSGSFQNSPILLRLIDSLYFCEGLVRILGCFRILYIGSLKNSPEKL
ncbi:unnamed protein product [Auanema sp. JU1783]|nr:unnamed protein product [Auanema sp. JU1783]